jgi:hypothetical protein
MGDILRAIVAIGGPILIAAAAVYGLLSHSREVLPDFGPAGAGIFRG